MMNRCRDVMLIGCVALIMGCASGQVRNWSHFHGNLSNQGFQELKSGFALSAAWVSQPYAITSSSPVIGTGLNGGEVLYVGTTDARLLAVDTADGSLLWHRRLLPPDEHLRIVSSPAVAENGDVYVLASRRSDYGRLRSGLYKFDKLGFRSWVFAFPPNVFTTGSPKAVRFRETTLIFVHVTVLDADGARGELYVLEDEGLKAGERSRRALNDCRRSLQADSAVAQGFLYDVEKSWRIAAAAPGSAGAEESPLGDSFLLPTPAVVVDAQRVLIAVVDNLCSLGVMQWDGERLGVVWQNSHGGEAHSSPALLPNNLLVVGRRNGAVLAFDLLSGVPKWTYDAGEAVLATPAGADEKFVFVVSKTQLHRLDAATGKPQPDNAAPSKIRLAGQSFGSPALTINRVYVASDEMLTVSADLKARAHDTGFRGNGLTSVALGLDGSVYAVAGNGAIYKYQGTH